LRITTDARQVTIAASDADLPRALGPSPSGRLAATDGRRGRGRLVVATEHERLAAAIRRRLAAEGHSVPDLATALGVGYRQLVAKLNGEVALRAEELVARQWLLGEHRSLRVPMAETALSNFSPSQRTTLTGWNWPF
jgi:hypothetical protein